MKKSSFKGNIKGNGFTLIELLVVILIIAMLAAVAFPQYQKAVLKTRLMAVVPAISAFKMAEEMFFLENGFYTQSGSNKKLPLDIDSASGCVPTSIDGDTFSCNNKASYINIITAGKKGSGNANVLGCVVAGGNRCEIGYVMYFDHSPYPNRRECWAYADNTLANDVCKSLGGTFDYDYTGAVAYMKVPFKAYVLP